MSAAREIGVARRRVTTPLDIPESPHSYMNSRSLRSHDPQNPKGAKAGRGGVAESPNVGSSGLSLSRSVPSSPHPAPRPASHAKGSVTPGSTSGVDRRKANRERLAAKLETCEEHDENLAAYKAARRALSIQLADEIEAECFARAGCSDGPDYMAEVREVLSRLIDPRVAAFRGHVLREEVSASGLVTRPFCDLLEGRAAEAAREERDRVEKNIMKEHILPQEVAARLGLKAALQAEEVEERVAEREAVVVVGPRG